MQVSADGLSLIQTAESFQPKPYYENAHVATVGLGHALTTPTGQLIDYDVFGRAKADQLVVEAMQRLFGKQQITRQEAEALMTRDLATYVAAVNKVVDDKTFQCEFDAMVSFCYNVGVGNFATSAVARLHKAGTRAIGTLSLSGLCDQSKKKASPVNMQLAFARWSNVNGKWALGLYRRRLAEVMVYAGMDPKPSITTAWGFHD
jgi:lysozyme